MHKLNQKGAIQFIFILILLAGIVAGVYLVQRTQIFKPKAATNETMTVNIVKTQCSTKQNDYQTINVDWSKVESADAYKVTLRQLIDNGPAIAFEKCMVADRQSLSYNYTLEGEYPILSNYDVAVVAYGENNGNCQWNVITAAVGQVTNQSSCVITGEVSCDSLATNKICGNSVYTQKNCTFRCAGQKAVYDCVADAPNDTRCVDHIRCIAETSRCLSFSGDSSDNE